jgi:hypothetical protein
MPAFIADYAKKYVQCTLLLFNKNQFGVRSAHNALAASTAALQMQSSMGRQQKTEGDMCTLTYFRLMPMVNTA